MRVFLIIALIISALIISGCDDGNGPTDEKGTLVVTSDPTGAVVFINGQIQSGVTTNASIELDAGNYTIRVAKTGYDASPDSIIIAIETNATDTAAFTLSEISDTGYVLVESSYDDAPVFIDGVPSGYSNETIEVGAGSHTVRIDGWAFAPSAEEEIDVVSGDTTIVNISADFVHSCLIEEFSHVNCVNCPDAAEAVQTVLSNYADSVYAVEWHPDLAGIDPFREDNEEMHDGRGDYYGVSGMPQVYVAAQAVPDPTSVSVIGSYVSNALSDTDVQRFKLWARVIDANTVRVNYNVASGDGTGVFKIAVVENHRHFDSPQGSSGMTDFHNIARRMSVYPTSGTATISAMGNFEVDFVVPEDLDPGEYHILAWFQNDADGIYDPGEEILCSPCRAEF